MNDETKKTLGERAVKCKGWRWTTGMVDIEGAIVVEVRTGAVRWWEPGHVEAIWVPPLDANDPSWTPAQDWIPDMAHPATLGCLLALVREAWGCDTYRRVSVDLAGSGFCITVWNGRHRPPSRAQAGWVLDKAAHEPLQRSEGLLGANMFATEAEALVAALEAAPG